MSESKKYVLKSFDSSGQDLKINYEEELNPQQLSVVVNTTGPCLVLAGAGSGKTKTLVYRVAYMIEKGISPDRILLMTFTNKASKEMLDRVESLLKQKPKGLWGGTFHHVGNRVLRMYGDRIGISNDFTILDQEDAKDLVKSAMAQIDYPKDKYFPKADAILKIISLSVNINEPIKEIISTRFSYLDESVIPKVEAIARRYQEKKRDSNSLDYDDLLSKWNDLLVGSTEIREKLQKKFQYILVDEYQDTNYIQAQLVKNLSGDNPNVLAVGDDSQSIYSFRGATVNNILDFPKIFKGVKTYKLETNYRSTPEILELANQSIRHNFNQFSKKLNTSKPSADKPVLASFYDPKQQADFICQRILELQQDEDISLNDMVVLFRAHYHSLEIEMAMSKRGIPYDVRGGLRFFEQAHIKDVIAHIKAFSNLNDEISWTRILRLQEGIGQANALKIWERLNTSSALSEALTLDIGVSGKVGVGWSKLQNLMQGMLSIDPGDIGALLNSVLKSGYDKYVARSFDNAPDRLEDLNQLVDFGSTYDSIDKFLSDVALSEGFKGQTVVSGTDAPDEAVTMSTIHQAKGLEWKVVFLVGLTDGQFPHAKVFEHPDQLEEERRLFYVATTRAKEKLYLTYPLVTNRGDTFTKISTFITEVPESVYDKWDVIEERSDDYSDLNDGEVTYVDEERGSILDIYLRNK